MEDLARWRLASQRLVGERPGSPAEVVAWFGAVQAQDYPSARWNVAQRAQGVTEASLERDFAAGAFVRTHVLRPTWHLVHPADLRWMLELTGPRVLRAMAGRHRQLELDDATLDRAAEVMGQHLAGGRELTRMALGDVLEAAGISPKGQRMPHILMHAELKQVLINGAPQGKHQTYALLAERVPGARAWDREEALAELVWRYFRSHGPAAIADFVWWSGLTVADARRGIAALGDKLSQTAGLYHVGDPPPRRDTLHLLANYDELLVAYKDRSASVGDTLPEDPFAALSSVVVRNGRAVALWRRELGKQAVKVDVQGTPESDDLLDQALAAYGRFLERPVQRWQQGVPRER